MFEGNGTFTDANENVYNGEWSRDIPIKGRITYSNGDSYEGQCRYNKEKQQIERNGKGTMTYANGENVTGKWVNNELVSKK